MQEFCTKLPLITGMFLLIGSVGFCSLPAQDNKEQTNLEDCKFVPAEELKQNASLSIHPWEDIVISIGLEKMNEPSRDISTLTRLERTIALNNGLEILAAESKLEELTAISSEVLADWLYKHGKEILRDDYFASLLKSVKKEQING